MTTENTSFFVIRRNGTLVPYNKDKIRIALSGAYRDAFGAQQMQSQSVRDSINEVTEAVERALMRSKPGGGHFHIEDIQDQVELVLMRSGKREVAREYVLFREQRAEARKQGAQVPPPAARIKLLIASDEGFDLQAVIRQACEGLGVDVQAEPVVSEAVRNLYDGISVDGALRAGILAARTMVERDPGYTRVTARLLMHTIRREARVVLGDFEDYSECFARFIGKGVETGLLDDRLRQFDLKRLGAALKPERDNQFDYLGLQTLYDRYFLHVAKQRMELPQAFFMRVAMGLSLNEIDRESRAIEFYELLSSFDFMSSTPTLFNAGTSRAQLSSCYLTTVPDDLTGIYDAFKDNALLSKFAGGLGNDWTPVRALGSHIKGTNGESQGVVPFLKVANDTAVAVNQCFDPNTDVYTSTGVKPIRDIRAGDLVLGHSGRYREVIEQMTYDQTEPMVEIKIKHSVFPIKVTAGHPFYAIADVAAEQSCERTYAQINSGRLKAKWTDAGKIKKLDYIAQVIPSEIIPLQNFTEDDARLYGILLGDGYMEANGGFGVAGGSLEDEHIKFTIRHLDGQGIKHRSSGSEASGVKVCWAGSFGVARCETTGQFTGPGEQTISLNWSDLYDEEGKKHIHPKFMHLPLNQAASLVRGLIETDGNISRQKEITFCSTSKKLADGIRYQMLRLGAPTSGQYRERDTTHEAKRKDGTKIYFSGITKAFDIRIPAIPEIANLLGCPSLTKRNWLTIDGHVFSRVTSTKDLPPVPVVHDLKVDVDESYMTVAGLAHNGGKRKGAVCAYLESWHLDIEEFLELRKNTGDDRRRTHDMNTANWIPDLFMRRVVEGGDWTLFSPSTCPDLHDLFGIAFEQAYTRYEGMAQRGEIKLFKRIRAVDLWRKMLSMLFETGHPWITFKDACNVRSPQQHVGVVHSSNLCTEVTLNTSADEIAVCNLGSVNLAQHLTDGPDGTRVLDTAKLKKTISTAMRMLDNVIDINYYAVKKARDSNLRHRPVGLGLMGFQDALYQLRVPYASQEAVEFADRSMEAICYHAYWASTDLAAERGRYHSFSGSLWDRGILPLDSLKLLAEQRGGHVEVDTSSTLDWAALRTRIGEVGMRNSNCVAIAPTATISNIIGVDASIEPSFGNLSVKSNLSGEFTIVNEYLVRDLKKIGLWDDIMVMDLKHFDGSLRRIDRVPEELKRLYATAFEVEPRWLVEAGARRQKWIDQAQSLNIYMAGASGKKLDETYKLAWVRGLKTTYYLRTTSASNAEKSTVGAGSHNAVSSGTARPAAEEAIPATDIKYCAIDDPGCQACQ